MVEVIQELEPKLMTPKQEALMFRLIESKVFSKKEFELFYRKYLKQITTSYDASIVISHLLAAIKFRKRFFNNKQRSHAKCSFCGSRKELMRVATLPDLKQMYVCKTCDLAETDSGYVPVSSEEEEVAEIYDDARAEAAETRAIEDLE